MKRFKKLTIIEKQNWKVFSKNEWGLIVQTCFKETIDV